MQMKLRTRPLAVAALTLGERPGPLQLGGAALIFAGLVVAARR